MGEDMQAAREDTYSLNCALRRHNRAKRKEEQAKEEAQKRAGRQNFVLPLAPESAADTQEAKSIAFRTDHDRIALSARRAAARAAPIFAKRSATCSSAGNTELAAKRRRLAQHARVAAHCKDGTA